MNGTGASTPQTSADLLGELARELSLLVRSDLELSRVEHAAERHDRAVKILALLGGGVAGLLALAAASLAAVELLSHTFSMWFAALVVALGWGAASLVLLKAGGGAQLLQRFSAEGDAGALELAQRNREVAEEQVRATAQRLAAVAAVEAVEAAANRVVTVAEHEGEALLRELLAILSVPGRAGMSILERLAGR